MPQPTTRSAWLAARKALLKKEKELTHLREQLADERRNLPMVKLDEDYTFDGPNGPVKLSELFDGCAQLLIYHFMFAPDWSQGCKSCSAIADHYDDTIIHLRHQDTNLVTVSRAPIEKLLAFRDHMGWTFPWVSSGNNRFNSDYGVYFTEEELKNPLSIYNYVSPPYPITDLPGLSVFLRDEAGDIYHTYSTYARGLDPFLNFYNFLDLTPKGRDEAPVEPPMNWLRHHDNYDAPHYVDPWAEQHA